MYELKPAPVKTIVEQQSEIVERALLYLQSQDIIDWAEVLPSDLRANPGLVEDMTFEAYEYACYQHCRKHWRELRKANPAIILPKKWESTYELDGWQVYNLSKGSGPYTLELIGEGELACDCEAYQHGNMCGHVKYAEPLLVTPEARDLVEEVTAAVDLLGQTDKALADLPEHREILPGIIGTAGQVAALDEMLRFIYGGSSTYLSKGYAGTGKLQPLTEPVLTPDGWVPMGEINPGSTVFAVDGTESRVLSVHPGSDLNIYKVEFCDGSFTYCCEDHLWQVQSPKQRQNGNHSVLSLKEMLPRLEQGKKSKQHCHFYSIPLCDPIEHSEKDLVLDPYLLGYMIGDGCFCRTISVSVHKPIFDWVYAKFKAVFADDCWRGSDTGENTGRIMVSAKLRPALEVLGLSKKKSHQKFIPKPYFLGSIQQRKSLLAGLLDTDGSVRRFNSKRVKTAFFTSSEQLAKDVAELVRSLGGYAVISGGKKRAGKPDHYQPEWKVTIRVWFNPFQLPTKKDVFGNYVPTITRNKKIVSAEYVGSMDGQCIYIDHPSHLYVTRDHIVTHNTTLVQAFISQLRGNGWDGRIVFTAPTNKAARVLARMVNRWELGIECITCAKLLGLKPSICFETGKQEFKKGYGEECTAQNYDLIVVDEASMINEELYQYLLEEANLYTRILFMGDPAQLPPVGEAISQAFIAVPDASELTEVKRYRGPIAELATDVRSNLSRRGEPFFDTQFNAEKTEGMWNMPRDIWVKTILQLFNSPKYQEDPDYVRALCYRNKTVAALNKIIRDSIRGKDAPRFVPGERLIATDHYSVGSPPLVKTVLDSSSEVEVLDVQPGMVGRWKVWRMEVFRFDERDTETIHVLHEDSLKDYEARRKELKGLAVSGKKENWKKWHELRSIFAWVDYAYAITIHKSQGSTFTNVFVDAADVSVNRTQNTIEIPGKGKHKVWERNQLLYVAVTRPSKRLFVTE